MRKTIGILFFNCYDFSKRKNAFRSKKAEKAFILFSRIANKKGFDVVFSDTKQYKDKKFKKAFIYKDGWKKVEDVKLDIIFDRCKTDEKTVEFKRKLSKEIPLYNNFELNRFCWDKASYNSLFGKNTLKIFLVHNKKQLKEKLKKIKTKRYVLKPRFGIMGDDVVIMSKKRLPKEVKKNTILQEFIDTSDGIKELGIKGVHDLRIIIIDGKIDHAYVRVARKGLISNIAQGGRANHIAKKDIPKKALSLVKLAEKKMKKYGPRLYTVDLVFDQNNDPIVLEMESIPVIDSAYKEAGTKELQKKFITHIVDSVISLK